MSKSEVPTVMGPEGPDSPGDLLQAPSFTSKTDKFQYRRDVRRWYNFVLSSAASGYNRAKGIASDLGHSLYSRLAPRYKRTIDANLDSGRLQFRKEDGGTLSTKEQIKVIERMFDIIAKDSTTDRVRRLVRMSKKVYLCRRKLGETFPEFTSRFQSVAEAYLSYANASTNGQDEQNFVMILLENAKLDNTTYNNIVKELVADAKNNTPEPSIQIPIQSIRQMRESALSATNICNTIKDESMTDTGDGTTCQVKIEKVDELKIMNESLSSRLQSINIPPNDRGLRERLQFNVTLDRALISLQDIKIDPKEVATDNPESDMMEDTEDEKKKTTVEKPKKIGTMLSGPKSNDNKNRNRYFAQKRRSNRYHQRQYGQKRQRLTGYSRYRNHKYHSDDNNEYDSDSSDEQHKHISTRLGKRKSNYGEYNKTVRFADEAKPLREERQRDRYAKYARSDDDSECEPYFRAQVRPRSRRT